MPFYGVKGILQPADEVYVTDTETAIRPTAPTEVAPAEAPTASPVPARAAPPPADASTPSEGSPAAAMPNNPSEISYSCVLIPRFSDHYLTGDLVQDLGTWMKNICIAYGWRLDALSIRPGYIHWIMAVPLTASPARFIKTICQQTSQKIFDDYPRFKRINPSLDFWAPSFSVTSGSAPQSMEEINAYILQVRKQQGIY